MVPPIAPAPIIVNCINAPYSNRFCVRKNVAPIIYTRTNLGERRSRGRNPGKRSAHSHDLQRRPTFDSWIYRSPENNLQAMGASDAKAAHPAKQLLSSLHGIRQSTFQLPVSASNQALAVTRLAASRNRHQQPNGGLGHRTSHSLVVPRLSLKTLNVSPAYDGSSPA